MLILLLMCVFQKDYVVPLVGKKKENAFSEVDPCRLHPVGMGKIPSPNLRGKRNCHETLMSALKIFY